MNKFIAFDGQYFETMRERNEYESMCLAELDDIKTRFKGFRSSLACGDLSYYGGVVTSDDGSVETELTKCIEYPFNIDEMIDKVDVFLEQIDDKIKEVRGE